MVVSTINISPLARLWDIVDCLNTNRHIHKEPLAPVLYVAEHYFEVGVVRLFMNFIINFLSHHSYSLGWDTRRTCWCNLGSPKQKGQVCTPSSVDFAQFHNGPRWLHRLCLKRHEFPFFLQDWNSLGDNVKLSSASPSVIHILWKWLIPMEGIIVPCFLYHGN